MIEAALALARANAALIAIVAPLIAAALVLVVPMGRWSSLAALCAASLGAALCWDQAERLLAHDAPAIVAEAGLSLRLDGLGVASAVILTGFAVLIATAALRLAGGGKQARYAVIAFCLVFAASLGAVFSGDIVSMAMALEAGALAVAAAAAVDVERRAALTAAWRLITLNAAGASLALLGLGLILAAYGSGELSAIASSPPRHENAALAGWALLMFSWLARAAAAPAHAWSAAFFGRAHTLAVLMFACCLQVAFLASVARAMAYAGQTVALGEALSRGVLTLGVIGALVGAVQAIGARDIRRLVGYASVAQTGCVLVALALGTPAGYAAALVEFAALAAPSATLLAASAYLENETDLTDWEGLGRRAPMASAAVTAAMLSLMGAPLTLGFLGRWRVIEAGVGGGWWWAAGAVLATSLGAVVYGGRVIQRLYFRSPREAGLPHDPYRWALVPLLLAPALLTVIGAAPGRALDALVAASGAITGWAQ